VLPSYRLLGTLSPARDNAVLVVHALTGTDQPLDWWPGVVGAGQVLDPARHALLCPTLPHTLVADDGTPATTRHQARALAALLDALEIPQLRLVCGGSLGAMVTLEFAASYPDRFQQAVALAAPAVQTAQGMAWNALMHRALAVGGPREGLALARMVGMLSYRSADGLEARFGNRTDHTGVASWMAHHGERLVARFNAERYAGLITLMDRHDVGAGRGGVAAALAPVASRLLGVGIPGDQLYPANTVAAWTSAAGAPYAELASPHGHDAFLLEAAQVSALLAQALRA
jgi:homoserine O-acetyltransferase